MSLADVDIAHHGPEVCVAEDPFQRDDAATCYFRKSSGKVVSKVIEDECRSRGLQNGIVSAVDSYQVRPFLFPGNNQPELPAAEARTSRIDLVSGVIRNVLALASDLPLTMLKRFAPKSTWLV